MSLPPATAQPCNECPWRKEAAPGWLGPHSARVWAQVLTSEEVIACHKTITEDESYSHQCRGAAIMRANILKLPRNREIAVGPRDRKRVFTSIGKFLKHHDPSWLSSS